MSAPIKVTGFIPAPGGGWKPVEELTEAEHEAFRKRLVARMGKAYEPYILAKEMDEDGKAVC